MGDIPPAKTMPNVVSTLSREDHASLKQRARANRRSLGSQLAFEAFAFLGLQAPTYLNEDVCNGSHIQSTQLPAPQPRKRKQKEATK